MLTALQNQQYKSGEMLTDKQIAHIMIALLMAGQHTSAATGSWAILHLGERRDLQDALFAEQKELYTAPDGSLLPLTYETLSSLPVLQSVIKEILRVHPPLHSLMRKVISDCPVPATLASPASVPLLSAKEQKAMEGLTYIVPKGHFVLAAPGVSQVDELIWGKNAGEFEPSRWLEGGQGTTGEDEDEGEEDYGWGKISKGGKSACECAGSREAPTDAGRPSVWCWTPPLHRRAVCQRPARHHHRDFDPSGDVDDRPALPRAGLHRASPPRRGMTDAGADDDCDAVEAAKRDVFEEMRDRRSG